MSTRIPPRAPGAEPEPDPGRERGPAEDDPQEEDRDAILARRAMFIASTLTGIALMAGCDGCGKPTPCLSIVEIRDDAGPTPCLSPLNVPLAPADAGADDAGEGDGGDGDAGLDAAAPDASTRPRAQQPVPRPCLTISAPNPPPPPPSVKK